MTMHQVLKISTKVKKGALLGVGQNCKAKGIKHQGHYSRNSDQDRGGFSRRKQSRRRARPNSAGIQMCEPIQLTGMFQKGKLSRKTDFFVKKYKNKVADSSSDLSEDKIEISTLAKTRASTALQQKID